MQLALKKIKAKGKFYDKKSLIDIDEKESKMKSEIGKCFARLAHTIAILE